MKKINAHKSNLRLDVYLSKELDISRSQIQKLITEGKVLLNGTKARAKDLVMENDEIEYELVREDSKIKKDNIPLDIVYEDDYLLVVNKQSGLVVHPAVGNKDKTLVNALMYKYQNLSDVNGEFRAGIVHRIDKDTSGLLVVAKDNKTHELLASLLKEHEIKRTYVALVKGVISNASGTIDAPIGRSENDRKKMAVTAKNSKEAITHFKVLKRFEDATLLECELETGRTHQIRVHLAYIAHPVIGDPLYGKKLDDFGQYLHAKKLEFVHPITKEKIVLECDLPKKFQKLLEDLEKTKD